MKFKQHLAKVIKLDGQVIHPWEEVKPKTIWEEFLEELISLAPTLPPDVLLETLAKKYLLTKI